MLPSICPVATSHERIAPPPLELNNLARKEPQVVDCLRARMMAWVERRVKETGKEDPILGHQIGLDQRIGSIATAKKLQDR